MDCPGRSGGGGMDPATVVPNEIWVKILTPLSQKELVRARLVCSSWRNVVDEHFTFSVIVHDDKTDLRRIYQLRVKDCLITKLNQDVHLLQFPEMLKRVRFWGFVDVNTFHKIISKATNLEEFSMTKYPLMQRNLFAPNVALGFDKIVKLEVLGYCCKDASDQVCVNMTRLLEQSLPSLTKIFVNVTCYWEWMDLIMAAFFQFLATHREQITHINASLIPAANGHELISTLPTNIPQDIKDQVYDETLQLESLRLSVASKYVPFWATILKSQRKLTDLRVHWVSASEQPQNNLTGVLCTLLYPPIIQSATTLVSLDLREVNLPTDETRNTVPFDAGILQSAQNLRRLVLVRHKDDCQRNAESFGSPTLINLNLYLTHLEDLEIVRFKCLSSDILYLVQNSDNLKTVKLQHNGTSVGQGVHGGIIKEISFKPSIKIINISPLCYHDSEQNVKLEALKLKFIGLDRAGDHVYFDFDRYRQGIPQPSSRYVTQQPPSGCPPSTSSSRNNRGDEDDDWIVDWRISNGRRRRDILSLLHLRDGRRSRSWDRFRLHHRRDLLRRSCSLTHVSPGKQQGE